ncbi:toll-like receptor 1 [Megalops cyprinoides]|uniref:toll-like receptor 1 n=1 Tax=Megalops cyprinoides TaxID=118141 RepID=UPI001865565E|nr:toll-like receptor 1 [Megalops cyprinoides]
MVVFSALNAHAENMTTVIVDLSYQNLYSVPRDLPPSTEALDISHNRIKRLTYDDFSAVPALRFLNASWNVLKEISSDAFRATSQLEYLDLSHNKLQNLLGQHYLLLTPKLQFLDLTFNCFSAMTLGDVFRSLTYLQNLALSAEAVKTKDFRSIANIQLQTVFLQLQNLTTYENGSLRHVRSEKVGIVVTNRATDRALIADALSTFNQVELAGINCSQNYLVEYLRLKPIIKATHLHLTNMEMSWDQATDLIDVGIESSVEHISVYIMTLVGDITWHDITQTSQLQSFSIKHVIVTAAISTSPDVLYSFFINMKVENLTVTNTEFVYMNCPRYLSNIKMMDFSKNLLTNSVFSFKGLECKNLKALETLILRGNRLENLKELSHRVQYMTSLQHLDVSFNLLMYKEEFGDCQWPLDIVHLNLSSNSLDRSVFNCLPISTETLDLQNNQIDSLPDFLLRLNALTMLDLSSNQLLDLPNCHFFRNLEVLLLSDNSLYTPTMSIVGSCPRLKAVDVSKNPFMCTCALRGFVGLQERYPIKLLHWPHFYRCSYPDSWRDTLLKDFHLPDVSCNAGILAAAILCPAVVIAIITLALCKQLDVPWYLGMIWQWTRAKQRARNQENLEGLQFHAFVSYSQHDADWVKNKLLPSLEEDRTLRVCQHERNFVPGKTIVENIVRCVETSYRCIFVLSSHFVRSEWCHYELYFAQHQRLSRGSDSVILILLEPLPQYLIPSKFNQLKAMMARRTYLEWPQDSNKHKLFWAHLRAALQAPLPPQPNHSLNP